MEHHVATQDPKLRTSGQGLRAFKGARNRVDARFSSSAISTGISSRAIDVIADPARRAVGFERRHARVARGPTRVNLVGNDAI
jgi:hypothetical protein